MKISIRTFAYIVFFASGWIAFAFLFCSRSASESRMETEIRFLRSENVEMQSDVKLAHLANQIYSALCSIDNDKIDIDSFRATMKRLNRELENSGRSTDPQLKTVLRSAEVYLSDIRTVDPELRHLTWRGLLMFLVHRVIAPGTKNIQATDEQIRQTKSEADALIQSHNNALDRSR